MKTFIKFLVILLLLATPQAIKAQDCEPCDIEVNENGFAEDLIQAGFHSILYKTSSGFAVSGTNAGRFGGPSADLLTLTDVNIANDYDYTGFTNDIRFATLGTRQGSGSGQFIAIASDGDIIAWGYEGYVLDDALTASARFGQTSLALPSGVALSDIKEFVATYELLALLTNSGVLYTTGSNPYLNTNTTTWNTQPLANVEDVDVAFDVIFAKTTAGDLYTWGEKIFQGNNTGNFDSTTPILMTNPLPGGVSIIQIAVSSRISGSNNTPSSYRVLGSDGKIYVLGDNEQGQLGIGNTTEQTGWVNVRNQTNTADLTNVVFISALDNTATILSTSSAIIDNGSVLMWGSNSFDMIGGNTDPETLPIVPNGFILGTDIALYVENGGHITPLISASNGGTVGNVGHNSDGAFGDGTSLDRSFYEFNQIVGTANLCIFDETPDQTDTDGDGVINSCDLDDDNDGILDTIEVGSNPTADADSDDIPDYLDTDFGADANGDGVVDSFDFDSDGIPDHLDEDSDNDGCYDAIEGAGSFIYTNLTSSNNLADDDEGSVDIDGIPTNTGSPQGIGTSQNASTNPCCDVSVSGFSDYDSDNVADYCDLDNDNDGILDAIENPCTLAPSGTWSIDGTIMTGAVGSTGISIVPTIVSGDTDIYQITNGTFNTTNFWSDPTIAGSNTIQFRHRWDSTPESSETPSENDAGIMTVTINFSQPLYELNLNIDRLGGADDFGGNYISNSSEWTLTTPNVVMEKLSGNPQLKVSNNKFYRDAWVNLGTTDPGSEANNTTGSAAGTIKFNAIDYTPITSLTFSLTGIGPEGVGRDEMELIFELCNAIDTDGDTIPDYLDLDSDGDGCADVVEGAGSYEFTDLTPSSIAGGSTGVQDNLGTSSNSDGTPTAGTQGIGTSQDGSAQSTECLCDAASPLFADYDNDTIADYCDLDDDNDGILDAIENPCTPATTGAWSGTGNERTALAGSTEVTITTTATAPADVQNITNGTFGSTNFWNTTLTGSGSYQAVFWWDTSPESSISDIDDIGNDKGTGTITIAFSNSVTNPVLNIDRIGGIGGGGGGDISNSLELTLTSGETLTRLSGTSDFEVTSTTIRKTPDIPNVTGQEASNGITTGTAAGSVRINGTFTSITFSFTGVGIEGLGNDGIEFILSEICPNIDTDGDTIPDYLDLDSDGDGCPDAVEGDGSYTSANLFTDTNIAGGNTNVQTNLGNTSNSDGTPDVGSTQGIGASQDVSDNDACCSDAAADPTLVDTDNDNIADFCDLDDDNDGILDTDECTVLTNLISNGDFQNGATDWTNSGNWIFNNNRAENFQNPTNPPRVLSQTLTNLNGAGGVVTFEFDIHSNNVNDQSPATNGVATLEFYLDGTLYVIATNDNTNVGKLTTANGASISTNTFIVSTNRSQLTTIVATFPYSGANTALLEIVFTVVNGGDDFRIDNLELNAMICDYDNDGIYNHLDLDSDGDGCPDAVEGDGSYANSMPPLVTSAIDGGNVCVDCSGSVQDNLGTASNPDGTPSIGATQGIGDSQDENINECFQPSGCNYNEVPTGLEALYLFESNTNDISGNGHDPVNTPDVVFDTDALEGTNSGQYNAQGMRLNDGSFFVDAFTTKTVSLFIKPTDISTEQVLYDEGNATNGISLRLVGGNISLTVAEGGTTREAIFSFPNDGDWHHVGFVYDGTSGIDVLALYIDGMPVNYVQAFLSLNAHNNGGGLLQSYGASADGGSAGRPYTGLIDDAAIYSTVLTPKNMYDIAQCAGTDYSSLTCNPAGFMVFDTDSQWNAFEFATGILSTDDDNLPTPINAMGYSIIDNRIWGYNQGAGNGSLTFTTIDANGNYITGVTPPIVGLPIQTYLSGDVDENGVLVFIRSGNLYRIDVNPTSPTYLQYLGFTNLSNSISNTDFAFHKDGYAYFVANESHALGGHLFQLDETTGNVVDLGVSNVGNPSLANETFGAVFSDSDGFLYVASNLEGVLYRVDLTTDPGTDYDETKTITFLQDLGYTDINNNDGAMCINAVISLDASDAPSSYGTLINDDGARHGILVYDDINHTANLMLGNSIDRDSDGVPSTNADGDDLNGEDDEDSIIWSSLLIAGHTYNETITVSNVTGNDGYLNVWIDYNQDGDFLDANEQIATEQIVSSGATSIPLSFTVPPNATGGNTYARIRLCDALGNCNSPIGLAMSGEVEDYLVEIYARDYMRHGKFFRKNKEQPMDFGNGGD